MTTHTASLSFKERLSYGLGDAASNFYFQFFAIFMIYYYTDVYGLSPEAVTTMILTVKLFDWITDPLMGVLSDRTRTRWGKYRPYILWFAIPYGLVGYLMFSNPDLDDNGKLVFAYISYILMMAVYTAINVPYGALMGVMSSSTKERMMLNTYRFIGAFSAALVLGMSVRPLVRFFGGDDEMQGFQYTMAIFAVISVLMFLQTFRGTRERVTPPPTQDGNLRTDLRMLVKNRAWFVMAFAGFFTLATVAIRGGATVYYFKYYLVDDNSAFLWIWDKTSLFLTAGSLMFLIGVIAGRYLSNHFEKRSLMLVLTMLNAIITGLIFFIPPEQYWTLVVINSLAMLINGPTPALVWSMFADSADYGEWKYHRRTTGLVMSTAQFAQKLGLTVGSIIPTGVLAYVSYEANAAQTAESLFGIRVLFTWIPAAFSVIAALAYLYYPLREQQMEQIEQELIQRRLNDPDRL